MSDLKKDIEQIEAYLADKSCLGNFARYDEPEYEVLRSACEIAGRELECYEYIVARLKAISQYRELQLAAFIQGKRIPVETNAKIEEMIADFFIKLKSGSLFK